MDDFIHAYGDPRQALLLFRIYHPNLIEINGNVVLEYYIDRENGPEKLITFLEKKEKSKKDILSGYRWLEIPYLFANNPLEEEDDVALAELIAENWRAVLQYKYPQQDWLVKILTPEETGSVIGVSFEEIE